MPVTRTFDYGSVITMVDLQLGQRSLRGIILHRALRELRTAFGKTGLSRGKLTGETMLHPVHTSTSAAVRNEAEATLPPGLTTQTKKITHPSGFCTATPARPPPTPPPAPPPAPTRLHLHLPRQVLHLTSPPAPTRLHLHLPRQALHLAHQVTFSSNGGRPPKGHAALRGHACIMP